MTWHPLDERKTVEKTVQAHQDISTQDIYDLLSGDLTHDMIGVRRHLTDFLAAHENLSTKALLRKWFVMRAFGSRAHLYTNEEREVVQKLLATREHVQRGTDARREAATRSHGQSKSKDR